MHKASTDAEVVVAAVLGLVVVVLVVLVIVVVLVAMVMVVVVVVFVVVAGDDACVGVTSGPVVSPSLMQYAQPPVPRPHSPGREVSVHTNPLKQLQ